MSCPLHDYVMVRNVLMQGKTDEYSMKCYSVSKTGIINYGGGHSIVVSRITTWKNEVKYNLIHLNLAFKSVFIYDKT